MKYPKGTKFRLYVDGTAKRSYSFRPDAEYEASQERKAGHAAEVRVELPKSSSNGEHPFFRKLGS